MADKNKKEDIDIMNVKDEGFHMCRTKKGKIVSGICFTIAAIGIIYLIYCKLNGTLMF